jgi:hypothetical protein
MDTNIATSVVVATVVNTKMSESEVRQHVVEQLQNNNRSLLDKLTVADADANVVTAVLNVEEFLAYLIRRFPKAVDAALATRNQTDHAAIAEGSDADMAATGAAAKLSEGEFMDLVLAQIESGELQPTFRISDEEWQEADDEPYGEDFSRHPFLY